MKKEQLQTLDRYSRTVMLYVTQRVQNAAGHILAREASNRTKLKSDIFFAS